MIAHQAIGVDLSVGFSTGLTEGVQKADPVLVIDENVLALVAAVHHVVHGTRILDAELSSPEGESRGDGAEAQVECGNVENRPLLWVKLSSAVRVFNSSFLSSY